MNLLPLELVPFVLLVEGRHDDSSSVEGDGKVFVASRSAAVGTEAIKRSLRSSRPVSL